MLAATFRRMCLIHAAARLLLDWQAPPPTEALHPEGIHVGQDIHILAELLTCTSGQLMATSSGKRRRPRGNMPVHRRPAPILVKADSNNRHHFTIQAAKGFAPNSADDCRCGAQRRGSHHQVQPCICKDVVIIVTDSTKTALTLPWPARNINGA